MIDSQFGELLGDDPEQFCRFLELTPSEVSLFPPPSPGPQRERIFFDADESQEEMPVERPQGQSPGNAQAQAESGKRPQRVNNTIFKTSLSEYRKSLNDEIKHNNGLGWLPDILKQVYGAAKNLSIFPKLNFMVRQLGIQQSINKRWSVRSELLLMKKQQRMKEGTYKENRLQQLRQDVNIMNKCVLEPDFEVAFERYWGNYRQETKHAQCKNDVKSFCKEFTKKAQQHKEANPNMTVPSKIPTRRGSKGKSYLLGRRAEEREERQSSTQC